MSTNGVNEPTAKGTCPSCFKDADLFMCSRCEDIYYCSKKCQKTDWPIHKILCEKLSKNQKKPRADSYRAIVFPADRTSSALVMLRPRFAWVRKLGRRQWDLERYFEKTADLLEYTLEMSGQTKPIATQKMFIAQSCPWMTLPVPNRTIQSLGAPGVCYQWIGDIVILGADADLNMRDFRAIVDWFQCYEYNKALLDPSRYIGHTYIGVKANCKGDMERHNAPELQQVHVSPHQALRLGLRSLGFLDDVIPLACSNPDPHALGMPPSCTYYHLNNNSLLLMLDSFFTDYEHLKNWKEKPCIPTGSLTFLSSEVNPFLVTDFQDIQDFVLKLVETYAHRLNDPQDEMNHKALRSHLTSAKWQEFLTR